MAAGTTVKEQFDSDRRGYQSHPDGGTPYHSQAGNPSNARREAEGSGRYGMVRSEGGVDHNDHASSVGAGTALDDGSHSYRDGYQTTAQSPTLDSPVPRDAPVFDTETIQVEDRAHMGVGSGAEKQATDDILSIGGVLSR